MRRSIIHPNAELHPGDAVRIDLATLDPSPRKVVANLPYGVAATVILKSIAELPQAELWVAMVQREVADRLAAAPGGKSYGATSVLAQLACDVRVLRAVPRTVFHLSRTWSRPSSCCAAQGPPRPPTSSPRARRLRPSAKDSLRIARAHSRRCTGAPARHLRGAGRDRAARGMRGPSG